VVYSARGGGLLGYRGCAGITTERSVLELSFLNNARDNLLPSKASLQTFHFGRGMMRDVLGASPRTGASPSDCSLGAGAEVPSLLVQGTKLESIEVQTDLN